MTFAQGVREVFRPLIWFDKTTYNIEQVAMMADAVRRFDYDAARLVVENLNEGRVLARNVYFLSNENRVVSFSGGIPRLIGSIDIHQYHNITLTCTVTDRETVTKRRQRIPAAVLVNQVFNGLPPTNDRAVGYVTHHISGRRRQNNPQNLLYISMRENCRIHPAIGRQALLSSLPSVSTYMMCRLR